jgi:hypothetical protein
VDGLDLILSSDRIIIESEDQLLEGILQLGSEYLGLLRYIHFSFLSFQGMIMFADSFSEPDFLDCLWTGVNRRLNSFFNQHWCSAIISDFPKIFKMFDKERISLLWRGSQDGFRSSIFHDYCDGHANTLTVILDIDGNIFGGFSPIPWGSNNSSLQLDEIDLSLEWNQYRESFLFTLRNQSGLTARIFPVIPNQTEWAIRSESDFGPMLGWDICIADHCNTTRNSWVNLGFVYQNDTFLPGERVLTNSSTFMVKEIEVFEILPNCNVKYPPAFVTEQWQWLSENFQR